MPWVPWTPSPDDIAAMLGSMGSMQLSVQLTDNESDTKMQQAWIKDPLGNQLAFTTGCAGSNTEEDLEACTRMAAKTSGEFGVIKHRWQSGDGVVDVFQAAEPLPAIDWDAVSREMTWDSGAVSAILDAMDEADECRVTVELHRVVLSGTYQERAYTSFCMVSPATLECAWASGAFTKQESSDSRGGSATLRELRKAGKMLAVKALTDAIDAKDAAVLWLVGVGLGHEAFSKDLHASAALDLLLLDAQKQLAPFSHASARLWIRRGEAQEASGDFAGAVQSYTSLLQGAVTDPSSLELQYPQTDLAKTWGYLALAHKRNGSLLKAEQAYKQAHKLSAASPPGARPGCHKSLLANMMSLYMDFPDSKRQVAVQALFELARELYSAQLQETGSTICNDDPAFATVADAFAPGRAILLLERGSSSGASVAVVSMKRHWRFSYDTRRVEDVPWTDWPSMLLAKELDVTEERNCPSNVFRNPEGPEGGQSSLDKWNAKKTVAANHQQPGLTPADSVGCHNCGLRFSWKEIQTCDRCLCTYYCSECQKAGWPMHKRNCKRPESE